MCDDFSVMALLNFFVDCRLELFTQSNKESNLDSSSAVPRADGAKLPTLEYVQIAAATV